MRSLMILIAIALLTFSVACEQEAQQEPEPVAPAEEAPAEEPAPEAEESAEDPRQETAMAAIVDLRDTLMGRVMSVASEEGFPAAVTVCREEAMPLTEEAAEKYGVALGRTSEKLRNQDNQPPAWFGELAADAADGPHFQEAETGELRGVVPIRLAAACTNCHGADDELAEGVPEALALQYPDDQATGYAEGDLRGFFWVEVP